MWHRTCRPVRDWSQFGMPSRTCLLWGWTRLIRGWEERLEGLWETREQSDLRHFVWYGLSEALLRSATKPYAMKAFAHLVGATVR